MRRILIGAWLIALVAAACTGDGESGTETSTTSATTPAPTPAPSTTAAAELKPRGGEVRFFLEPPPVLNPLVQVQAFDTAEIAAQVHSAGVWRFDGRTGQAAPDLVVALPSQENGGLVPNDDGTLTVRYEIDPAAVWSDGTPISGDDFAFTHALMTDPSLNDVAVDLACDTPGVANVRYRLAHEEILPGSIVAGPKTFEYRLGNPGAYSGELFRWIVPEHQVAGTDFVDDWKDRLWASAGPFVFESIDRTAGEVVFVRNENYWRTDPETGQQLPHLDRLVLSSFNAETAATIDPVYRELNEIATNCPGGPPVWLAAVGEDFDTPEGQALWAATNGAFEEAFLQLFEAGVVPAYSLPPFSGDAASRVEASGGTLTPVRTATWEHIAFHFGDARLRANADSLVEHVDFRRAVAHALDRDRIATEAFAVPSEAIGSLVDAYSNSVSGTGWDRYDYDPDEARRLISALCERLDRDCMAEPPRLVFSHELRPDRVRIAQLVEEMLEDAGIEVELREQGLFRMIDFAGCSGWEASTFGWNADPGFSSIATIFEILDPSGSANPLDRDNFVSVWTPYAWGTDAVQGVSDDQQVESGLPPTPDCDESVVYNQGPSSVRDEFTARFDQLLREAEAIFDPAEYLPVIAEMEEILADQAVIIPLHIRPWISGYRPEVLGGYGFNRMGIQPPLLWNAGEWCRIDG